MSEENNLLSEIRVGKLSTKEQEKLLKGRKVRRGMVSLVRGLCLLAFVLALALWIWIKVDLDPKNQYLSSFGIPQNTGQTIETLKAEKTAVESEFAAIQGEMAEKKERIKTKNFSEYSEVIQKINEAKRPIYTEDETGIFDFIKFGGPFLSEEFSSSLLLQGNKVTLKSLSYSSTEIKASFEVKNFFGKTFTLSQAVVDFYNAHPSISGASVRSFSRKNDNQGIPKMDLSFKLNYTPASYEEVAKFNKNLNQE